MARTKDVATFDTRTFRLTVDAMKARGERVHDAGEQVFKETGRLDPMVDVFGKVRLSHNAMIREGDVCRLVNGPKIPLLFGTDGTGSMGENVAKAFFAMGNIDAMLAGIRGRYQMDISFAVLQDVVDPHPPYQMAEFESDNRAVDHVRMLIPDKQGGDEIEDYDLGLWYVGNAVDTDIVRYGLKGYYFVVADQIGRGVVTSDGVNRYLGHKMQGNRISTRNICRDLLSKWHLYYVQVGSGRGGVRDSTTDWWEDKLERGRVVVVPDPDCLAEVQAGLIYVTETLQPTEAGLIEFLLAGGANRRISQREAREVWGWLQDAGQYFGAQARLPGYLDIPKPGDVFVHYRHVWPIGHPRANENITPGEAPVTPITPTPSTPSASKPIDWSKF